MYVTIIDFDFLAPTITIFVYLFYNAQYKCTNGGPNTYGYLSIPFG